MRIRAPLIGAILALAFLGQPFGYAFRAHPAEKERQLAAKIERQTNPGKKARLQIRLARLKLLQAIHAYDAKNLDRGWMLLKAYRSEITQAWKTLQDSPKPASKHLGAYMKLEINLREDGRMIRDLRHRVPYPASESVKAIAEENSRVHEKVLGVLFPPGTPPQKSSKPRRHSSLRRAFSAAAP